MRNVMAGGTPLVKSVLIALLLYVVTSTSGCVTSLGYIPERIESIPTEVPPEVAYSEAHQWAGKVADGYATRATMNRYAIFGGATIAAAAVSAMAGLAAFDTGSSALIGIPIGTGFLASVAAIYSNEGRAQIYDLAKDAIKRMMTASSKRAAMPVDFATDETQAQAAVTSAEHLRKQAEAALGQRQQELATARVAVAAAPETNDADRAAKKVLTDKAQAAADLVLKAHETLKQALLTEKASQNRLARAKARVTAEKRVLATRQKLDAANAARPPDPTVVELAKKEADEANNAWERVINFRYREAMCLREDVEGVMALVETHLRALDPKNLTEQLKRVKREDIQSILESTAVTITIDDLSDLKGAQSVCGMPP